MSDPVTNVEIEDVLSSIRKLVADETRATPAPPMAAASDRLILTPEQRVKEPPDASFSADPVLLTNPVTRKGEPQNTATPRIVQDRMIEDIALNSRLADFGDVEGPFPDAKDLEANIARTVSGDAQGPTSHDNTDRLELGRLIGEEVTAALNTQDFAPSDAQDVTPDDSAPYSDDLSDDGPAYARQEADITAPSPESSAYADAFKADAVQDLNPVILAPQTLEDKVAALGRLVARDTNDFEEERDVPDPDDFTATSDPMIWPDPAPFDEMVESFDTADSNVLRSETAWRAQADVVDEDIASDAEVNVAEAESKEARKDPTDADVLQIDESMLRAMVGEIVREELQGALGERITRNVRKLVRREIHRMLISQEID